MTKQNKMDKYIKHTKRTRKPINETIQRGIRKINIPDLLNTDAKQLQDQTRKLLKPLIKDKEILEIMLTEENLNKIQTRFEHHITIIDATTKTPGWEIHKVGITPEHNRQLIHATLTKGEIWTNTEPKWAEILRKQGYTCNRLINQGEIQTCPTETTFRKA